MVPETPAAEEQAVKQDEEVIAMEEDAAPAAADAAQAPDQQGEESSEEQTVEDAQELFEFGCAALNAGDFEAASDDFSKSLEIRVKLHGELAPECASAYFKYGCALLCKVQSERDAVFEPATARATGVKISEPAETEGAAEENAQDNEEDGEDIQEEEESDLELAWKMMDIARVIYEKQHTHTLEEVDVIAGLADISLEKEDFQTCFDDYNKALEILKGLVEPDNRQLAELYFKMALAKQLARVPKEAIEYCQHAISVCESRLERLRGEAGDRQEEVKEMETLLVDLKEKADELQQMASAPPLLEILKAENPEVAETVKQTFMAVANGSKAIEGPAAPSSSKDGVINLGVVGRGIKRAVPIPDDGNASDHKMPKRSLESLVTGTSDGEGGSGSTQIGFSAAEASGAEPATSVASAAVEQKIK